MASTVVFGVATTVCVILQANLLAQIIADISRGRPLSSVTSWIWQLGAVILVRAIVSYLGEWTALASAAGVKTELRHKILRSVIGRGPVWLSGQRAGSAATLVTRGLDALDPYFSRYIPSLVLAVCVPVAVLIRIGTADLLSVIVICVALPLVPIMMILIGIQTREKTDEQWRAMSKLGGHFLDVVEGLPTLKIFGRAKAQAAVIRRVTGEYRKATMTSLRWAFLSGFALDLISTVAVALVAVEVGMRLRSGDVGYETALVVLILTPEVYLPIRAVGTQFHASMEGVSAAEEAFSLIDEPEDRCDAAPAAPGFSSLTFDNVAYRYPGRETDALSEVNLTVRSGERVVLVGPSGAGKSTFMGLVLRFIEPDKGRILLDGIPTDQIDPGSYRERFAWVPQQPYLFASSVSDNIRLGAAGASNDQVREAANAAGALEFIEALPQGFDTPLGERGLRLSSGQRQRIALARAFLRDAPVLLLDEPTAHLDVDSAGAVSAALDRLMADRTVILISHTNTFTGGADRIIHIDSGALAEVRS